MRFFGIAGTIVMVGLVCSVLGASLMVSNAFNRSQRASERSRVALERAVGAEHQASVSKEIAEAVRDDRRQTIVRDCQETNIRHKGSVAYLTGLAHREIHEAKRGKKRRQVRKEATRGLSEFKLLFDALAPVQDCKKLEQRETTQH